LERNVAMAAQISKYLQRFLRYRIASEEAKAAMARRLRQRERSFLRLMQRTVYSNLRSPYRALLRHAGIALPDLAQHIARDGLERTLAYLYDAGIYVSTEEFKGRRPIRRGGLELAIDPHDFDNPLMSGRLRRDRPSDIRRTRRHKFPQSSAAQASVHRPPRCQRA
jgi:hypothetical protein